MLFKEFLSKCTACGGNWVAMLLTGIERVFPEYYESVVAGVEKVGFGGGGIKAFTFVCDWLSEHGVIMEEE